MHREPSPRFAGRGCERTGDIEDTNRGHRGRFEQYEGWGGERRVKMDRRWRGLASDRLQE